MAPPAGTRGLEGEYPDQSGKFKSRHERKEDVGLSKSRDTGFECVEDEVGARDSSGRRMCKLRGVSGWCREEATPEDLRPPG